MSLSRRNSFMPNKDSTRYSRVAIILHWVMAICFILMLASGLSFALIDIPQSLKPTLYFYHKSLGVLLLITFFIRIGWRIFHQPPRLPVTLKKWDRIGAKFGHWALYGAMILMPLSGWIMSSKHGDINVFNLFNWPAFPILGTNDTATAVAKDTHEIIGWVFLALIIVHIAGVIKHYKYDQINLISRMWFKKSDK